MIYKVIFFSLLFCILTACNKESKNENEILAEIYVNLLIIQESYTGQIDSVNYYKAELFNEYNLTEENYQKGILALELDKDAWNKFFDYSLVYLDSLRKEKTVSVPDTLIKQF
jgi:hypothetical protein